MTMVEGVQTSTRRNNVGVYHVHHSERIETNILKIILSRSAIPVEPEVKPVESEVVPMDVESVDG